MLDQKIYQETFPGKKLSKELPGAAAMSDGEIKARRRVYMRIVPRLPRDARKKGQWRMLLCCQLSGHSSKIIGFAGKNQGMVR